MLGEGESGLSTFTCPGAMGFCYSRIWDFSSCFRDWKRGGTGDPRCCKKFWQQSVVATSCLWSQTCIRTSACTQPPRVSSAISQGDHIPATLREMMSEGHRDRACRGSDGRKGIPSPSGLWTAIPTAQLKAICGFVVPGCPQLIQGRQRP